MPPERRPARLKTVASGGIEYTLSSGNVFADQLQGHIATIRAAG